MDADMRAAKRASRSVAAAPADASTASEPATQLQHVERRPRGVGGAQLRALSVIHANPGIGVNDLART